MKRFLFLNFIYISFASANCSIQFFKNTIYVGNKKNLEISDLIKKTDCSKDLTAKIHKFVISSSGTLKSKYLEGIGPSIEFFPNHFYITPLTQVLKEKMGISKDQEFDHVRFMNGSRTLHLREGQFLDITAGFKTGKMVFTLEVLEKGGNVQTIWVEARGSKSLEVYVASNDLSAGELSLAQFKKIKRKVTDSSLYFLDEKTLPYHKLNRSLKEGGILKKSFLIKKNLVKFGTPARVLYQKGNLVLKGMGIPLSTGRLGDFVKLRNPKNNKEIFGKVNGVNSVLVGL